MPHSHGLDDDKARQRASSGSGGTSDACEVIVINMRELFDQSEYMKSHERHHQDAVGRDENQMRSGCDAVESVHAFVPIHMASQGNWQRQRQEEELT